MSNRMEIPQYSWEKEQNVVKTVNADLVQEFITYIMLKSAWKVEPELLLEKVLLLRKKLAEDIRDPVAPKPAKRDPALGYQKK